MVRQVHSNSSAVCETSRYKTEKTEDTSHSFIRPLIHMRIILYENATKWLDGWLDERRWCAEPPHFSSLSGCAYGFEPRTLHHETLGNPKVFAFFGVVGLKWLWDYHQVRGGTVGAHINESTKAV